MHEIPKLPAAYYPQHYSTIIHGIGTDDEPPFIPYVDPEDRAIMPEGEFKENVTH